MGIEELFRYDTRIDVQNESRLLTTGGSPEERVTVSGFAPGPSASQQYNAMEFGRAVHGGNHNIAPLECPKPAQNEIIEVRFFLTAPYKRQTNAGAPCVTVDL